MSSSQNLAFDELTIQGATIQCGERTMRVAVRPYIGDAMKGAQLRRFQEVAAIDAKARCHEDCRPDAQFGEFRRCLKIAAVPVVEGNRDFGRRGLRSDMLFELREACCLYSPVHHPLQVPSKFAPGQRVLTCFSCVRDIVINERNESTHLSVPVQFEKLAHKM